MSYQHTSPRTVVCPPPGLPEDDPSPNAGRAADNPWHPDHDRRDHVFEFDADLGDAMGYLQQGNLAMATVAWQKAAYHLGGANEYSYAGLDTMGERHRWVGEQLVAALAALAPSKG